ncbi:transcription antitermination factor NusB [Porphyromonas circumdentaria]|uniref:transcription antitermination factor NusB n=1 Tax=Porphyromonas circumdentaria TaxID=29524 RepID=UPI0026DD029A|nr:transcription antitermination factor NusB [Porphyromonas circumdentaria]MDO4722982.1 transcription antitermination factor NusB [Porphyromonas circumdentaria]
MINRTLIRIRVLQELFSYYHTEGKKLQQAEVQLTLSIGKTHDLYLYLIDLIPTLTRLHAERLERRKNKFFKSKEEASPNMRLVNNRLAAHISASEEIAKHIQEKGNIWSTDTRLLGLLLDEIESSELYRSYCQNEEDNFQTDVRFWISALNTYTFKNSLLDEFLESTSIYWDSPYATVEKIEVEEKPDIETVEEVVHSLLKSEGYKANRLSTSAVEIEKEFAVKTLRKASEDTPLDETLLPLFKDEEDATLPLALMRATVLHAEKLKGIIDANLHNWEMDRVTDVDMIILQMALAELLTFSNIPATVTLNEYIELAKIYSTSDSGKFVNGVLDSALKQLKKEGRVTKI